MSVDENEKVKELAHLSTHLLALTSHQLKTPMGIIRGYTTLLREGFYGPLNDDVKEVLSKIEFNTEAVVALVDKITDLRKIEEDKIEYEIERLDFVQVGRRAAEEMGHMALSHRLDLSFSGPDHPVIVRGDEQKLYEVIQNLIDNAVKYTAKGSIKVTVEEKDADVVLSVADSGMGIAKKIIPLLFQEFVRDKDIAKEIRGTGIGLYVARIFMEAQGGKIWVESEGPDKGATFSISLPLDK
ncbi:MAG TPA: HAMP domain-containing sensor histidine kinase [Candidatus Paceibacterota bacterium]|nr:HAMP domain-containing sensor histidine kinase [Candidatus Paceibacterota bacterium]